VDVLAERIAANRERLRRAHYTCDKEPGDNEWRRFGRLAAQALARLAEHEAAAAAGD
jgi:hypothetical protein